MALTDDQIRHFIEAGFVKLEAAFPAKLADEGRAILWRDTGCHEADPATWTKPVIRLGMYGQHVFANAVNTPVLHEAFDQIVGRGRWLPRFDLGTFPVRFPSADDPGDTGWHVDTSFPPENSDASNFLNWRVNVFSTGRALLMLFLFSDVGEDDAPTRIRAGSHVDVARMLAAAGETRAVAQRTRRERLCRNGTSSKCWQQERLGPCTSATHSWFTQLRHIAETGRAFAGSGRLPARRTLSSALRFSKADVKTGSVPLPRRMQSSE